MASSSLSQPTAHAPPPSPSKRQKLSLQEEAVVEKDDVDRISDLPDCLLCHNLSFLPTKKSVATSILSSRWKTLWTFVPCLYLDYTHMLSLHEQWNDTTTFPHIVYRVFDQHKAPQLRKFLLNVEWHCDAFHVDTWVRASISLNLSFKNLVVLKLRGRILLNLPSSFKFPSLKILHLWLIASNCNDDPDWKLLSGCPVLEDLVLERYGGNLIGEEDFADNDYIEVVKLEICVPTLKRLKIAFILVHRQKPDYVLEINAPNLEYFNFKGELREVVFLEKLHNLVEADLDISVFDEYGEVDDNGDTIHNADKVLGLLRELYNVKFLSLSHDTTECLSFAYDHYGLPMFHNLARLNYEFSCCHWHVLPSLLQQSPNLEVLVVDKSYCRSYAHSPDCNKELPHLTTFNFSGFKRLKDMSPLLTSFYFRGFIGLKDELKFVF